MPAGAGNWRPPQAAYNSLQPLLHGCNIDSSHFAPPIPLFLHQKAKAQTLCGATSAAGASLAAVMCFRSYSRTEVECASQSPLSASSTSFASPAGALPPPLLRFGTFQLLASESPPLNFHGRYQSCEHLSACTETRLARRVGSTADPQLSCQRWSATTHLALRRLYLSPNHIIRLLWSLLKRAGWHRPLRTPPTAACQPSWLEMEVRRALLCTLISISSTLAGERGLK